MATFTESFTSAVDGSLADVLVTTDLTWTIVETDAWEVTGNQASPRGANRGLTGYARAEHDTDTADHYAEIVVTALVGTTTQGGPCARYDAAANNSYMAMLDVGDSAILIRRTDAGTRTTLATSPPVDLTGLPKVLRIEVEGTTIRGFWDGVQVVSAVDSTYQTQTRAGMFGHEHTNQGLGLVIDSFGFGDLSSAISLVVADATHPHSADAVALTQVHQLAVDPAIHGHTADSPALTQVHQLVVQDATHAHTADQVTLTGPDGLDVADAQHGHVADSPTITQLHVLVVNDATHGHTVDAVSLAQQSTLTVDSATHAHAADSVTLVVAGTLAIADATHSHVADGVVLTQVHVLTVADATHAHSADVVTLIDPTIIIPDVLTLAAVPNPLTLRNLTPVLALTIVEDE